MAVIQLDMPKFSEQNHTFSSILCEVNLKCSAAKHSIFAVISVVSLQVFTLQALNSKILSYIFQLILFSFK